MHFPALCTGGVVAQVVKSLLYLGLFLVSVLYLSRCQSNVAEHREIQFLPDSNIEEITYVSLVTHRQNGQIADPVNLAFIGDEAALSAALNKADWTLAAAPTVLHLGREILDIFTNRSDPEAPVSNLYLFGRREDLAFQKDVGPKGSPRRRHHMRIWKTTMSVQNKSLWVAAATFDTGISVVHLTHKIQKAIDAERDVLVKDLEMTKCAGASKFIAGIGRNHREFEPNQFTTDGKVALFALNDRCRN